MADIDLRAPEELIQLEGGNDASIAISLPLDTTAATHKFLLSTTDGGTATKVITTVADADGNVITVGSYSGGSTTATVTLSDTYTTTVKGTDLYYSYQVTISNARRTYLKGLLRFNGDITE